jgi:signal transduction histidine kinase/ligand-binding sensor domain-containing protein
MRGRWSFSLSYHAICALGVLIAGASLAAAERLPIKVYTTADGLANTNIQHITLDSRGFLWFCTFEGLSRFDGYGFASFGTDQGLPSPVVNDFLETPEGRLWVATDRGLCLFNPKGAPVRTTPDATFNSTLNSTFNLTPGGPMFTVFFPGADESSRKVICLLQDSASRAVWCGTESGIYRLTEQEGHFGFDFIDLGMPSGGGGTTRRINSIVQDKTGSLWVGSNYGMFRIRPGGNVDHYDESSGLLSNDIICLLEDRNGRLWAGSRRSGLYLLNPSPTAGHPVVLHNYGTAFPGYWISRLFQASDGAIWAATNRGLVAFVPAEGAFGFRFRLYSRQNGLPFPEVESLGEDRGGNIWMGIPNGGAARLARSGITAFGEPDGVAVADSVFTDQNGNLVVVGSPHDDFRGRTISKFDGERFVRTNVPVPHLYFGWGWGQVVNDHQGEWWLATFHGLMRFPRKSIDQLSATSPNAIYTTRNGLAGDHIFRIFEDSRGDIWASTVDKGQGLIRWDRATGVFHHYTERDGLPSLTDAYPTAFCEDRGGGVWIGFSVGGGLLRYRSGRFDLLTGADGLPEGGMFNLFVDSAGRLWAPTSRGGVWRIDNPTAERPIGHAYTTAEGLASNNVLCVTEDSWGRIYLGTGRGIDRLDLTSGNIRHYSAADGVLAGDMLAAHKDRDGTLWFCSANGLMRLIPKPDLPPLQPTTLITELRIAGVTYPISASGESDIGPLSLTAAKNNIEVSYVGLGQGDGADVNYQYKLDSGKQDWSQPTSLRTLNFADLSPGRYRLLVRAISAEGAVSGNPATVTFKIVPPFWLRWWFLAAVAMAAGSLAYGWYRYRIAQFMEIARVRARISGDLHDDIGANLSRMAILSEVAHQQMASETQLAGNTLSSIASISRESMASMRDIVWAVNPNRDRLFDLTQRMRGLASDILTNRDIEFEFLAPGHEVAPKLAMETRRNAFLIFKEAVNNAVRHSRCNRVKIQVSIERGWLKLELNDNGAGFDPEKSGEGQGLSGMRRRAQSLGGELDIISHPAEGTTVRLRAPIKPRPWPLRGGNPTRLFRGGSNFNGQRRKKL